MVVSGASAIAVRMSASTMWTRSSARNPGPCGIVPSRIHRTRAPSISTTETRSTRLSASTSQSQRDLRPYPEKMRSRNDYIDALDDTPPAAPRPDPADVEERLRELKKRMGKG